jgi:LPS-assembly lipoprotein
LSPERRHALLALLCAPLAACGLHPMYAGGGSGAVARDAGAVMVSSIQGKAGYLVHNDLTDRLGAAGTSTARYRLDVRLDDKITGMIVQTDDSVSRERRAMRARYQLIDLESGATLLDATADADAGVDIVASEYAVIAAEQTAQENLAQDLANQIVIRVATRLHETEHAKKPGGDAGHRP